MLAPRSGSGPRKRFKFQIGVQLLFGVAVNDVAVGNDDFTDDRKTFTWFDGKRYTGKALSAPLNVKFSPTVMVFNAKGAVAGKPILGSGLPEFYGVYLDELIQSAWAL